MITDKGYHSRALVSELTEWALRTYCSKPNGGPQRWRGQQREQHAVYGNRRRIRGERGVHLLRQRGEKLERWNQHLYDCGGMRWVHLGGRENILKRLVVHSGAANLELLMSELFPIRCTSIARVPASVWFTKTPTQPETGALGARLVEQALPDRRPISRPLTVQLQRTDA